MRVLRLSVVALALAGCEDKLERQQSTDYPGRQGAPEAILAPAPLPSFRFKRFSIGLPFADAQRDGLVTSCTGGPARRECQMSDPRLGQIPLTSIGSSATVKFQSDNLVGITIFIDPVRTKDALIFLREAYGEACDTAYETTWCFQEGKFGISHFEFGVPTVLSFKLKPGFRRGGKFDPSTL